MSDRARFTSHRIERRPATTSTAEWGGDVHPIVQRVFAARGVLCAADADLRLGRLLDPGALGGIAQACALLQRALVEDWRIVVVGDFDADGATGTAVAVRGLRLLGAQRTDYRVPNRMLHGYGLSPELVATLAAPDLIVTVDNGIASHAGVAAAKAAGARVLITDHHLPGSTLPDADAIVNPNLTGDGFPSKALAGVGVMFYLLLALRASLRAQRWFGLGRLEPDLSVLLDLVALGTVADLVPLDRNNRVLVAAGMRRIRGSKSHAGVRALIAVSGREDERMTTSDLAFAIAPRLNAAGRLEDMSIGIECLLTDDAKRAQALAERLHGINAERRELQAGMVEQAEAAVARWGSGSGLDLPIGLCLFEPDWHAGVVGLVASRLKDRLNRPVIALAPGAPDSDELKGSARSVAGFHLRDALADVDARHPGLIERFGGHAMAAGLSLRRANLPAFALAFDRRARETLGDDVSEPVLWSDGPLDGQSASLELAEALQFVAPWGQAFPEPAFDNEFELASWRVVGERHLRLALRFADCGTAIDAMYFGGYDGTPPPPRMRALYQLAVDTWRGERRLRLLVRHIDVC